MTQNSINNKASELTVDNLFLDGNTLSTTDTDGNLVLSPDGTGVTSTSKDIHTSGISFDSGTNVLANFVDTTAWTPVLEFGGGTTGITYSARTGSYSRIGNLVFLSFSFNLSNKGSSTGDATITGFPFTAIAVSNFMPRYANITLTGAGHLRMNAASSTIIVSEWLTNGPDPITNADFANNSTIQGSAVVLI